MSSFVIRPEFASRLRWSKRGSCGNSGCTDPECGCSLCGKPIGVPENDPRWDEHEEYCGGCPLCEDEVPIHLFRGKGKNTEGVQLHNACFQRMIILSQAGPRITAE